MITSLSIREHYNILNDHLIQFDRFESRRRILKLTSADSVAIKNDSELASLELRSHGMPGSLNRSTGSSRTLSRSRALNSRRYGRRARAGGEGRACVLGRCTIPARFLKGRLGSRREAGLISKRLDDEGHGLLLYL